MDSAFVHGCQLYPDSFNRYTIPTDSHYSTMSLYPVGTEVEKAEMVLNFNLHPHTIKLRIAANFKDTVEGSQQLVRTTQLYPPLRN